MKIELGTKVFCHINFPIKGSVTQIIHEYFTVTDKEGNEYRGLTLASFKPSGGNWFEVVA